jgi:hypothetical protein
VESQPRRRRGHGSVVKSSPVWCEWGDKGREEGEDRVTPRSGDTTKWRHDNEEETGARRSWRRRHDFHRGGDSQALTFALVAWCRGHDEVEHDKVGERRSGGTATRRGNRGTP